MSENRLARLEAALTAQQGQIDQLRAENAALRREPSTSPSDAPTPTPPGPVGRRSLLTKGLAAAGAATAGAVLLGAEPTAAANGQALVIGGNNFGTAATRLNVTYPGTDGGLQIVDNGGLGPQTKKYALVVSVTGDPLAEGISVNGGDITAKRGGVQVETTGTGLSVTGGPWGIIGHATASDGYGVTASGNEGVYATGTAVGVNAMSFQGTAVRATGRGGAELDASEFHLRFSNTATRNAPTGDSIAHLRGDVVETSAGELWVCTSAGTPGSWRKLAGPNTAGAFHVLPAPARVYDSRPGVAPTAVGPKTPFAANTTRTFDLKVNSSLVPAGATAAMVTLLLVNAANANGNLTIWANGAAKPVANTLVWGGSAGRFTATAVTALDAQARVQVNASARTDLVIDVVGFYR